VTEIPSRLSRSHGERTIAIARLGVAAFTLFAVWLDPPEPERLIELTYVFHFGYIAYSLVLVAITWRRPGTGSLAVVTHIADIAFFSVLQFLTLGPSSPFFFYFNFSLFCAAIRWGWKGVAVTAPVLLVAFLSMIATAGQTLGATDFGLNRILIRGGYLVFLSLLLVYLGRHEARLRDEIRRLAGWPAGVGDDIAAEVRRVIDHAVGIVEAERVAVVWELVEEPRVQLAAWTRTTYELTQQASSAFDPWVAAELVDQSFVCTVEPGGDARVVTRGRRPAKRWLGHPVHPALRRHVGEDVIASAPFSTERLAGRVFFGALREWPLETLAVVDVVAREIGASIDKCEMHKRTRQLAIGEDRIRVARDLHDGVLQSLTGIRLDLQSLATHVDGDRPSAEIRSRLMAMERALATEQRELRFFIEGLQPERPRPEYQPCGNLGAQLDALTRQLAAQWKTPVTLRLASMPDSLPSEIEDAVPRMIHEAVVNALKHGSPSRVIGALQGQADGLRVVVSDDGRGFPFEGQFDHAALVRQNLGPASLCERVASLGGDVSVDSSVSGSKVEIRLPATAHA